MTFRKHQHLQTIYRDFSGVIFEIIDSKEFHEFFMGTIHIEAKDWFGKGFSDSVRHQGKW